MAEKVEIIITASDKASGKLSALSGKLKSIGKELTAVGKTMTTFVTAPIVAGFVLSVKAASDLEESMNKVRVVFGDAAGEVLKFSENAATGLGMSRQNAIDAAGTFGNLFTSMGIGVETSADMSTSLLTLAADLASFNNIDPTIALEKLRAGLVGEVEPLRTLGVNLSAAAVEAKALEMGLVADGEELTAAAKAQAAYALILEQTTNAQGDFARTSDGLANSTRIVKAQLADFAAELGQQLLPIALQVVTALRDMMDRFNGLSPAAQKTIVIIAGVAAAIGPLLIVVGQLVTAIGVLTPVFSAIAGVMSGPVLLAVGALIVIVGGLIVIWKSLWEDLQKIIAWVSATFGPLWQALGELLTAVVGLAVRVLAEIWKTVLLPALERAGAYLNDKLGPAFRAVSNILSTVFGPVIRTVTGWVDSAKAAFAGLGSVIERVAGWISTLASAIRSLDVSKLLGLLGLGGTPGKALGGPVSAGSQYIVGEFGPELFVPSTNGTIIPHGMITNNAYNLTINEAGSRGNVVNDFALLKALAGA